MEKINEEVIEKTEFSDEMKRSYIDYSMSVITSRAIPDVRDGLKPVQRRVLYDMNILHINSLGASKKCARIVGDTMGKYHPHGDSSIYDTLVVMAQDFKKRIPLIDGHGNFGSIEGDGAAAERYTEAKLYPFTEDVLLKDLDKMSEFVPNYDGIEKEPVVLPARLPLLLINGTEGIAVGMATSIPSHNLTEVCDLCISYIKNPKMSTSAMLGILKGPDFPTGGIISNKKDLKEIYETGTGKIKIRGKIHLEKGEKRGEKDRLVITEIPYTMIGNGIERFLNDVANLAMSRVLPEIVDISNQSSKEGIRIVLELKNNSDIERVKNILYKKTKLEDTFGVNFLAIKNQKPEIFTLKTLLSSWLDFQKEILTKKYTILLKQEQEKNEIQAGLLKACDMIDLIIEIIRSSKTVADAKRCLMTGDTSKLKFKTKTSENKAKKLTFTELQADAILRMQLQKLIGLEITSLKKEYEVSNKNILEYSSILSDNKKLEGIIKKDIQALKNTYNMDRLTDIRDCEEIMIEDKKETYDCYFLLNKDRYCKIIDESTYERNLESIKQDYEYCIKTTTEGKILLFSDTGFLYRLKCSDLTFKKYKEKGEPIENLLQIKTTDQILYLSEESQLAAEVIFITKNGNIKRVESTEFITNKKCINSCKLSDTDCLMNVIPYQNKKYMILVSKEHKVIKFSVDEIPVLKKTAVGVKAMELNDDMIIQAHSYYNNEEFFINEQPYKVYKIRSSHRGGKGTKK